MGIISTFDPKFQKKTVAKNIERYGVENVIHIKKSKLFCWIKVVLPWLFWTIVLIWVLTLIFMNIDIKWLEITLTIMFMGLWLVPIFNIVKLYLDYKMDFILVNPIALIRYNQEWFFTRISKTIELRDIRSTSVRKSGFIDSLFNNWCLTILSEGVQMESDEDMRVGEIVFRYVYHPDLCNSKINKLLAKH